MVLLTLRNTYKEDIHGSAAEMVFGTTLKLPGQLFEDREVQADGHEWLEAFSDAMRAIKPTQAHHHRGQPCVYVAKALTESSHVWVRLENRQPLTPQYDGPFRVLQRNDKTFKIIRKGKTETVSIDRLKPAYLPAEWRLQEEHNYAAPPPKSSKRVRFC